MLKPLDIVSTLVNDLTLLAQRTMIENGVANDSELVKSVQFIPKNSGLQLLANDYYEYLSTGRRAGARKVPINDLIDWIKKKGIAGANVNAVAWRIQQSIYRNGIRGKFYSNPVEQNVADMASEQLAEILSEVIADEMVMAFELE